MHKHRRNIIYTGIQVTWRLILGDIFFLLSNILLILLSWNIKFNFLSSILYIICSLTVFPSLIALVNYLRNDTVEDQFILGLKVYFKSFKEAFKTGALCSLTYELLILFLLFDLISANRLMKNGQLFVPLLTLLIILSIVHLMWNILVQNYFYVKFKSSFIYSIKLLMAKPQISLEMVFLIFIDYLLLKLFPQYSIIFVIPLTAYILKEMTAKEFEELKRIAIIKE